MTNKIKTEPPEAVHGRNAGGANSDIVKHLESRGFVVTHWKMDTQFNILCTHPKEPGVEFTLEQAVGHISRMELNKEQYKLELPGGSVEIFAGSDIEAMRQADVYLKLNRINEKGLKLFRYPKEYVNRSVPLVELSNFTCARHGFI